LSIITFKHYFRLQALDNVANIYHKSIRISNILNPILIMHYTI